MEQESKKEEMKNLFSLIIEVKEDGSVVKRIETEEKDFPVDKMKLVGLLELVKTELMDELKSNNIPDQDLVEVILEEEDFLLPQSSHLKEMGKKVGDKVILPKSIALVREGVIGDLKAQKLSGSPSIKVGELKKVKNEA